jgi:hypothetical protein
LTLCAAVPCRSVPACPPPTLVAPAGAEELRPPAVVGMATTAGSLACSAIAEVPALDAVVAVVASYETDALVVDNFDLVDSLRSTHDHHCRRSDHLTPARNPSLGRS